MTTTAPNLAFTDVELSLRVQRFFAQSNYPTLRLIKVANVGGTVTLSGQVASFYEKQLSLHLAGRVAGVRYLIDVSQVDSSVRQHPLC